jgi:hypothetical protein
MVRRRTQAGRQTLEWTSPASGGVQLVTKVGQAFFFEKKNQKTFDLLKRDAATARDSTQKFFASFFQKRSAFFNYY